MSLLTAAAVLAALAAPVSAVAADTAGKPVCLDVNRIDHTEVLNSHQILFYMYGKKVWVNTLTSNCSTLTRQDGFVWESGIPKYCDNLEIIRVLRTGETCQLGAFTPYEKASNPS
jgi:hypothetical protein